MSTTRTSTLSPIDVTVVISQQSTGVVHIVSGYMEDSHINIERSKDTYTSYTGVDNVTTRIHSADTSAKVTLSLQQSSASNDVLSQLYVNDKNSRNSSGLFAVTIKDGSGRSVYFSQESWIGVVPNSQFGSGMNGREWVIHSARMDSNIGGNSLVSVEDASVIDKLGGNLSAEWRG